nr:hypothetical protein [Rhodopirellula sallentina]
MAVDPQARVIPLDIAPFQTGYLGRAPQASETAQPEQQRPFGVTLRKNLSRILSGDVVVPVSVHFTADLGV